MHPRRHRAYGPIVGLVVLLAVVALLGACEGDAASEADVAAADVTTAEGPGSGESGEAEPDAVGPDALDPGARGPNLEGPYPYEDLTDYGFFSGELSRLEPVSGVIPYELSSPLWSDGAFKARFIVLPEGGRVAIDDEGRWLFPVGTIIIKNFYYPEDLRVPDGPRRVIETRLLIRTDEEWENHEYLWNDSQTDAARFVAGTIVQTQYIDEEGTEQIHDYVVPNTNQCDNCHSNDDETAPIGPRTAQMNRDVVRGGREVSQLDWLDGLGIFEDALPPEAERAVLVDPRSDAPLDARARSYLEANCGHCHRPGGEGGSSGLVLLSSADHPADFGVCKKPVAAGAGSGGFLHAIVPGDPDSSILVYRMNSVDPEIKMPEIPNLIVDDFGVELIREWISGMEPPGCP